MCRCKVCIWIIVGLVWLIGAISFGVSIAILLLKIGEAL